jgi:hypothetical protein
MADYFLAQTGLSLITRFHQAVSLNCALSLDN